MKAMFGRDRYRDRADAGRRLADAVAEHLRAHAPTGDVIVLGLPRGGVPVAAPIARRLGAPLDVLTVRKIGTPGHEELAIGAVATGGLAVLNDDVITQLGIPPAAVEQRTAIARSELAEREGRLRGARPAPDLRGRTVVLVDDGLATGATMRAAIAAVRTVDPAAVLVAVPVGSPEACAQIGALADELVCPMQPRGFSAVGQWYDDFSATTDRDVLEVLEQLA